MMRRVQSVSLVIALLAAPLALVARGYACAPVECTMACCQGRMGSRMMMCQGAGHRCTCWMAGSCEKNLEYGLAAPLPPTQLSAAVKLQKPRMTRANFVAAILNFTNGYFSPPFEPPRA
ncbi:MAG TPA: hypothetical protein VKS20_12815 [Candidatus Acidoferrales bacterium]|nr:hypothetical protein [Candidatus Acidoferrales bacterium]